MLAHLVHARDIVAAPVDRRYSVLPPSTVVPSEWAAFSRALYQKAAPVTQICLIDA